MKAGHFVKTEQAILEYILQARTANIELTGTIINIKAEGFAKKLREIDFSGFNGIGKGVGIFSNKANSLIQTFTIFSL